MSANRIPLLAQSLFNRPLLITADKAEIVMATLADRFGIAHLFRANGTAAALGPLDLGGVSPADDRPFEVVQGIAVIPIEGTLVHRLGSVSPHSGMTGYDGIAACFMSAITDPSIRAVCLDIDSPGGDASGCFDLADLVYRARGSKPIWAIVDDMACSAAYAVASAADRIMVPRTGTVGSIGVIAMHTDMSRALSAGGITVTVMQYGARKADGADVAPLTKEARTRFQTDIDTIGDIFVSTVARNRGLSADAVRGTEAATFLGAAGVTAGLADGVSPPADAFAALLASIT
jgi:signal peptide peptidase SppA